MSFSTGHSGNTPSPSPLLLFNSSGLELPFDETNLLQMLMIIEKSEQVHFSLIEVVYVDEDEITRINREYLGHDYITDIISFPYDENQDRQNIEGTLYCCAPKIREQSHEFKTSLNEEFYRVFIHGLLHLSGYEDKTEADKRTMTELEDKYLKS